MIQIKLSADNVRLLEAAKTEQELRGAVNLVLERVRQMEALKGEPKAKNEPPWKVAFAHMRHTLGDNLTIPRVLDAAWIAMTNKAVREIGLDLEYLTKLAEHARDHMRMPIKFSFLVGQHERCMAGQWDVDKGRGDDKRPAPGERDWFRANQMPED